ncbi:putative reverse transcriptase domain-containing protein [Tanacetum coccineum]
MTSVPALSPVSGALSLVRADLIPSPKRVKDSVYLADVEVDHRETSLRDDVIVRGSDEPHLEQDIDREIQAEIDECIAYADALRDRGIDESSEPSRSRGADLEMDVNVLRLLAPIEESETVNEGPVERFMITNEQSESIVEQSIEGAQREQGHRIIGAEMAITILTERVAELERDNRRLRGTASVESRKRNGKRRKQRWNEMEREETEMEEMEMEEMEMEEMEIVMGTKENMAITLEDLCLLERVVGLTRWFEKMGTNFHISNCPKKYQVKYASCMLLNSALTWWNSHKRTIGNEAAYAMSWEKLMKLMTEVYCLRNEIQKMETELWNLTMKVQHLMDQKLKGYARSAENKRRLENNTGDNGGQQPVFKRHNVGGQNVVRAYTGGNNERKGPGHFRKDCPKLKNQNRGNKTGNRNGNKTENQTRGNEATAKAYAIGGGGANPDSNIVTSTFLLNNYYASMLFDSGVDKSFVSSTFSVLLGVVPSTLDTSYTVELVDEIISETNIVLRGCTLGLLGHPFGIDLMPVELGSFDIIIGMDWLAKYHALTVCDEKIVHIPYGDEVLII